MDNFNALSEIIKTSAIITPIIVGVVQSVKLTGMPAKYSGLLSIIIGILFMFGFGGVTVVTTTAGVAIGLMASGLWSNGKTIIKK